MIRVILGAVAEYERSIVVLRLRRGRAAKAATGGYAYGSPSYGKRAEDRQLVPDPAEQATISRILELAEGGASLRSIAPGDTFPNLHPPLDDSRAPWPGERLRCAHW